MKKNILGFTIIELIVVITIVGVLSTIAIPTYKGYIQKSRRLDGQSNLLKIQTRMEEYFVQNNAYPPPVVSSIKVVCTPIAIFSWFIYNSCSLTVTTSPSPFTMPASTYYSYSFESTNTTYTIKATAVPNQANDKEGATACNVLTIDNTGTKAPAACWPAQ